MHNARIALAVFVVTASSSAFAQNPPVEPSRPLAPTWSLGAGISFGFFGGLASLGGLAGVGSTPAGGLGGLTTSGGFTVAASPNVSLERVFSSRFALGLGLEGGFNAGDTVGATLPNPSSGSVALGLSPRFTLTSEDAPVGFTAFATAFAGYSSLGAVLAFGGQTPMEFEYSAQLMTLGAAGGFALEKRFFERLAIRIQAQFVRVTLNRYWTTSRTTDLSSGTVTPSRNVSSVVGASFVPSPSIELRLYL